MRWFECFVSNDFLLMPDLPPGEESFPQPSAPRFPAAAVSAWTYTTAWIDATAIPRVLVILSASSDEYEDIDLIADKLFELLEEQPQSVRLSETSCKVRAGLSGTICPLTTEIRDHLRHVTTTRKRGSSGQ
jgi:hypothetical protein